MKIKGDNVSSVGFVLKKYSKNAIIKALINIFHQLMLSNLFLIPFVFSDCSVSPGTVFLKFTNSV